MRVPESRGTPMLNPGQGVKKRAKRAQEARRWIPAAPWRIVKAMNPASATAKRRAAVRKSLRSGPRLRELSWLEPLIFVLLAFVYTWEVQPADLTANVAGFIALALLPPLSNFLHRERPSDLGFRLDNLGRSAREVGLMTAAAALVVAVAGLLSRGRPVVTWTALEAAITYPLWALAQQYALQGFVFRRLRARWGSPWAAAGSAALFSALHYPSAVLMVFTLIVGYDWCRLYERAPNLYTLALSHGWLAMFALIALPAPWMHGLKVGPGYWTWSGR